MKLNIYELFGENCMTKQAGQKLYEKIHPVLHSGEAVELDFADVKRFLSVFFNFAIGQLFRDMSAEEFERSVIFFNLNPVGRQTLQQVIENAKRYYANPEYREAVDTMVTEQSLCL